MYKKQDGTLNSLLKVEHIQIEVMLDRFKKGELSESVGLTGKM